MRKVYVVLAIVACGSATALAAPPNPGPYTGSWTYVWDFNDGTQGWSLSGGYWDNWTHGQGTLFLPDTNYARWDADSLKLAGVNLPGGNRFILEADIFVGATNYLQGSGIGAARVGDFKGPWVTGTAAGSQGMAANDKSWFNTTRNKSWGLAAGQWTKVQLDYGYSTPGYFWARYQATPGNPAGWPAGEWEEILLPSHEPVTHPSQIFRWLQIGGSFNGAQTGWAQAYYDNVKLQIPEPATMALLALGGLGFLRRRRA